ncbi:hypothetical protein D3C77_692510 [compost metagenome]
MQATLDGLDDLFAEQVELLVGRLLLVAAQVLEHHQLHQQREQQDQPGNAVAPADQLAPAGRGIIVDCGIAHN